MPTKKPARKPAPPSPPLRAAFPPAHARAAPARPDRAGPRRPRAVLRLPRLLRLGRRARRLAGRRGAALAARRGALSGAGRAGRRRRDPDAAAGPARRAAVSRGAICLFVAVTLGLSAGTLGVGPGGTRPDWWDAGVGQDPRRDDGGDARLGRHDARRHVGAHILADLPVHRGRAAADRRVGRGRDQGDVGLGLDDHARAARRGATRPSAPAAATDDLATLERSTRVRVERPEVFGDTPEFETPAKPKRARRRRSPPPRTRASGRARSASRTSTAASACRDATSASAEPSS